MPILLPHIGDADIKKVYYEGLNGQTNLYPLTEQLYNVISDDKAAATILSVPDVPLLNPRATKVAPTEDTPLANDYRQTFTHVERSRKVSIPFIDVQNRGDLPTSMAMTLATRTRQTIESLLCAVIANGFTTTLTARSEVVFLTTHALLGGGTASNRLAAALTHDNFAVARSMLLFQATDYGGMATHPLQYLVVPKELNETGFRIQNASATSDQLQPTSYRGTFAVLPMMFASDVNDWFVFSGQGMHSFTAIMRIAPMFWSKWVEDTMTYDEYAYFCMSQGVVDYRGSVGSIV